MVITTPNFIVLSRCSLSSSVTHCKGLEGWGALLVDIFEELPEALGVHVQPGGVGQRVGDLLAVGAIIAVPQVGGTLPSTASGPRQVLYIPADRSCTSPQLHET